MAGSVYEGKTFDEAVMKGLKAQRLERAEAVITIIEEGKSGFLGIGSRPFRVSVLRRPGGPLKEPVEREDRGARGARGGRDERGGRGGRGGERGGRGGRDEKPQGRDGGRDGGRGGRDGREDKPNERAGRGGRDERRERDKPAQPAAGREERGGRGERGERAERPAREERAPREPREVQAPAAVANPSPVPPQVSEEGGDDSPRKRRRRGRRGGRGRRRGGEGGEGGDGGDVEAVTTPMPVATPAPAAAPAPVVSAPVVVSMDSDGEPKLPMAPAPKFEGMNVIVHTPAHAAPPVDEPIVAAAPAAETTAEAAPRAERPERRERRDRGERGERPSREERAPREPRPEGAASPEMSSEELGATSKQITEDLLRRMGFEPKVEVRTEGNRVDVTIEVERDDHLLNGRGGETRLALQHILNRFLNKGDGSRYHLQLEVNDFWEQRENELAEIARQLADQAVAANAEIVGEPMNSMERRIVHMTLREDARVKTYSLGDGAVKRVAVAPAGLVGGADDSHAG